MRAEAIKARMEDVYPDEKPHVASNHEISIVRELINWGGARDHYVPGGYRGMDALMHTVCGDRDEWRQRSPRTGLTSW